MARDLGKDGVTYPILETDVLQEIEARASASDWRSKLPSQEAMTATVKAYRPKDLMPLPRAVRARVVNVDMTYTLEMDIPDGKGGILYPKGFVFNPLDYMTYPFTMVVLDGDDPDQVAWLKASPYPKDITSKIMLTGGSAFELSEALKRPVFYVIPRLVERLRLSFVPAVVRQKERMMEVTEIDVVAKIAKKP
jgi:conjugal transfer pilus assembly protein TraW